MSERFDVLFAGQVLEGHDLSAVRLKLGRLFKADEATLDKLFSGKPQILKRNAEATTAGEYQQAMAAAGARALLRACEDTSPAHAPPAAQRGLTLAPPGSDVLAPEERAPSIAAGIKVPDLELAPVGADVLDPQYRRQHNPPAPDTSHLSLVDQPGAD